ncbi:MAG: beta-N-acetylhexosaminidase [Chloroflexi bacterium]|nr:beta-N-acetylhexosaminidase [Chloroflexota bacterium]
MDNLSPKPAFAAPTGEKFILSPTAQILVESPMPELLRLGNFLADALRDATGYALPVSVKRAAETRNNISLALDADATLGAEGYTLNITPEAVALKAHRAAGLFYGIQTLRQLLPPATENAAPQNRACEIACGILRDAPRFAWRGTMLDVARHFFKVEEVKRYVDLLAAYKLNRLHLHLTDDQGWRIEIKTWDKLATIGGSTGVNGKNGGYYTQDEYRELVAYAAERYIVVVPEIDMPGHTNAALASYPDLNCSGSAPALYTGTDVGFSSLCIDKEITYQFVDDVVRELAALTPSAYIHIGGDEAHATDKDAYVRFIERVQQIVHAHGKQMMGWEEIAQAQLSPQTIVQHWFSDHAAQAVRQGARVILSPAHKAYLDMQYNETSPLGLHWAGYVEVQDAYNWDPATQIEGVTEQDILGVEAPLWSETLTTLSDIEYMAFPRLAGIAEIGWSPQAVRDWSEYRQRLAAHGARWTQLGINFYRSPQVPW